MCGIIGWVSCSFSLASLCLVGTTLRIEIGNAAKKNRFKLIGTARVDKKEINVLKLCDLRIATDGNNKLRQDD